MDNINDGYGLINYDNLKISRSQLDGVMVIIKHDEEDNLICLKGKVIR